jgi:protein-disulfide isomerase
VASRKEQKEQARAKRLAEEQARAARASRARRMQLLGGVLIAAVAIIVVAIVVSSSGGTKKVPKPNSKAATAAASTVDALLAVIPQSGTTLGNPKAPVTVTEFGDLECPICMEFATGGAENQIIQNDVKTGKAKLIYRSLETASGDSGIPSGTFQTQQVAAYAAGAQNKAWNYIELFYHEQGTEDTQYVTPSYLAGLAAQIPGFDVAKWQTDRQDPAYASEIQADAQYAASKGYSSTPTVIVTGPKGEQDFSTSLEDYSTYQSAINSVS